MKKRREKIKVLSLLMMVGLLAAGCGSTSKNSVGQAAKTEEAYDAAAGYASDDIYVGEAAAAQMPEEKFENGSSAEVKNLEDSNTRRKLIRNVTLEVETETFDELLSTVEGRTQSLGGYIEESYTYNGSNYYGRGSRNASLTIRIPAEKLNEFLSEVSEISNVISRNESVTDVTLQYVDMESRKKALQAEQGRLLELLERAESIEDIISIEGRLSEVRYQIESMESQLRTMDNQVTYSTVYLYINEVAKLTPVKEQSTWEKISTGFANSLYQVGNGMVNFGINVIISLPYLIVWAVIIVVLVLLIRFIIRCRKKKKDKEQQEESGQNPVKSRKTVWEQKKKGKEKEENEEEAKENKQ